MEGTACCVSKLSVSTRSSRAGDEQNAMGKQAMEGQNLSEEQGRLDRGRDLLAGS